MATKAYGKRKGDKWVKEVVFDKHFYRKYQAWMFHPHFKQIFSDPTLSGCEIRETKTGSVYWISSLDWLAKAQYKVPERQYALSRSAFTVVSTGRVTKLTDAKNKTPKPNR